MLIKQNRYEDVIKILKPIIERVSEYSRLLFLFAMGQYKTGEFNKAINYLNKSYYQKDEKIIKLKEKILHKLNESA